jgi:glycosyltransferase involved in cell wall biosynthesis
LVVTLTQKSIIVQVTVVFPAFNEAPWLEVAVERTTEALSKFVDTYEVIIAEDGATDGTDRIAERLSQKKAFVKHLHGDKRLGRGVALNNAFHKSAGEVFVYMDVDLATDLKHLKDLVDAITVVGYDLSTGSRLLRESKVQRSLRRQFTSKSYNFWVRKILGSKLKDHQCGFKAFKRETVASLIPEVQARHWFWDTEILVRAQRKGLKVKEIPVEWKSGRKTKVNLLKDSFNMGKQVLQLWWKFKTE